MAISIIQNLPLIAPAFGDNLFVLATSNTNAEMIKHELIIDSNVVVTTYAPVHGGVADLHLGPTYRSVLDYFNNPVNDAGISFYNGGVDNHNLLITDKVTEVIDVVEEDFGDVKEYNRRIIKAVDAKQHTTGQPAIFCNQVCDDGFINRFILSGQKVPLMILTGTETNYNINLETLGETHIELFGQITTDQRMGQGMKTLSGNADGYVLAINGSDTPKMRLMIDHKCYPRKKTIYWLNRFGGWDWFNGIDYERIHKTEKLHSIRHRNGGRNKEIYEQTKGNIMEYKLFGRELNSNYYLYLMDMISSPIAFDDEGNRIRILDTNVDVVREEMMLEPEVRIEYLKENSITY